MSEQNPTPPTPSPPPETQQSKFTRFINGFNQASTFIQWLLIALGFFFGYWLYIRDAQTVSGQTIQQIQNEQKSIRDYLQERKTVRDNERDDFKEDLKAIAEKMATNKDIQNLKDEQLYQRQLLERIILNQQ